MTPLCHIVISLMADVVRSPMSKVSQNVTPFDPPRLVVVRRVRVSDSLITGDGAFGGSLVGLKWFPRTCRRQGNPLAKTLDSSTRAGRSQLRILIIGYLKPSSSIYHSSSLISWYLNSVNSIRTTSQKYQGQGILNIRQK